ncbi:MAG TPA: hypothetical protein VF595_09600 [Tepidisphaeraceae bacterium]
MSYSSERVSPPQPSPPVLDYGRQPALVQGDRGLLLVSAVVMTLMGVGLSVGIVELLIVTWPSFGVTLVAVPAGVVALAFLNIAYAAGRAAMVPDATTATPRQADKIGADAASTRS